MRSNEIINAFCSAGGSMFNTIIARMVWHHTFRRGGIYGASKVIAWREQRTYQSGRVSRETAMTFGGMIPNRCRKRNDAKSF